MLGLVDADPMIPADSFIGIMVATLGHLVFMAYLIHHKNEGDIAG